MTERRATLSLVAELSGVSAATVSKVINRREDVAAATRARVQSVLDELRYELPGRRREEPRASTIIDFICESLVSDYQMEVLQGVVGLASGMGVDIVVSTIATRGQDTEEWAQRLAERGHRGAIFVTSTLTNEGISAFRQRGLPVVVIDPYGPIGDQFVTVGATNWAGGRTATDHLLDLGHRRIGYIGGGWDSECQIARMHGHMAALRARGIVIQDDYITGGGFTSSVGVQGLRTFLELEEPPTAIFAASDSIAIGVYEEAFRSGLEIPRDLSIVGFDGTATSERALPPLTTVAQPLREMGAAALRLVQRQLSDGLIENEHMELATTLIPRSSTALWPAG